MDTLTSSACPGSCCVGILYPGRSAEDDFLFMASALDPPVTVRVAITPVPVDDAMDADALSELGTPENLAAGVAELRSGRLPDSAVWACTSASFLRGSSASQQQVRFLERELGIPASTTSLAFLTAIRKLGVRRAAVASPYAPHITDGFVRLISQAGVRVVSRADRGGRTAAEIGGYGRGEIGTLVKSLDLNESDALLIPDTALHTASCIDDLEDKYGKPVLTANQVTAWIALRLAGFHTNQSRFGLLLKEYLRA